MFEGGRGVIMDCWLVAACDGGTGIIGGGGGGPDADGGGGGPGAGGGTDNWLLPAYDADGTGR